MLLAVAGLDRTKLDERTKRLSSTDWSTFPAGERAAFFYARQMSKEPWTIADGDYDTLVAHLGAARAVDVVWWASRCHYMTRVADAFQIPLERENVFDQGRSPPPAAKQPPR